MKDEPGWPIFKQMKEIGGSHTLILSFVLLFGTMVGPVNLFWLAPSNRRHRLFITTPLISLAGSLVLGALIFLKDGTGGSGIRFTAIQIFPEAHEENVIQEQIVRTGLLLGSRFTTSEDVAATPLILRARRFTRDDQQLSVSGKTYSGDWFRSRYTQAMQMKAVRPTRASITVVGHTSSGAPEIVSSIETSLETLVIADADKKLWEANDVPTGQKVTMHPADPKAVKQWWRDALNPAREGTRKHIADAIGANLDKLEGSFCASTGEGKNAMLGTLGSIHWQKSPTVYIGDVVEKTEGGQAQ
jgi:hypothetical protein